jgi:ABC-2 type transport system permease protein
MPSRAVWAAVLMQARITRRSIEDLFPVIITSLSASVALAVLVSSGRADLAGNALVAAVLMGIGQMSFFVGSEILANERENQLLEALVAAPTSYFLPLLTRIVVLTSVGTAGVVVTWAIATLGFGLRITIHHPAILFATLVLTILSGSATALVTSALFSFGRTTRTYQNALAGPLYLLGGVLVPVTFLPAALRPLSHVIFLYWSADLLRDSLLPAAPQRAALRLGAILLLGALWGTGGAVLVRRMLDHLRREGTIGL